MYLTFHEKQVLIHTIEIREEIRHQNMSFTEIAKTVGEKWQVLKPEEKEAFEKEATAKKIYYTTLMAKYKQTENYEEYNRYLADFTAKNAPPQTGMIVNSASSYLANVANDYLAEKGSGQSLRQSSVQLVVQVMGVSLGYRAMIGLGEILHA